MNSTSAPGGGEGTRGGSGSFQVHLDHPFEGLLLTGEHERTAVALCGCGVVLSRAKAVFTICSECDGTVEQRAEVCRRCGGSGEEVDHAALEWRTDEETEGATW